MSSSCLRHSFIPYFYQTAIEPDDNRLSKLNFLAIILRFYILETMYSTTCETRNFCTLMSWKLEGT